MSIYHNLILCSLRKDDCGGFNTRKEGRGICKSFELLPLPFIILIAYCKLIYNLSDEINKFKLIPETSI